ncbi:MAG: HlyD family efflux transporter periplasmic adaptor subunit [Acetatifactor sp.]|nr:HlyD family efflux transporter periplasmic adaptor subunit [Acetatifactor sp.]
MKKASKKKKVIIIIVVVLVLVLISGSLFWGKKGGKVKTVTVTSLEQMDLTEEISITGSVSGMQVANIYAPASGVLQDVNVSAGMAVEKGQVLATYDPEAMEKNLRIAQLQWERTQISYESSMAGSNKGSSQAKEANTNLKVLEQQIKDSQAYLKNLQEDLAAKQAAAANEITIKLYNLQKQLTTLTPGTDEYNSVAEQISQIQLQQSLIGTSDEIKKLQTEIAAEQERLAGYEAYKAKMEGQKMTGEGATLNDYNRQQMEIERELAEISYNEQPAEYEKSKEGVSAPFAGVVRNCMIIPGSSVASGMQMMTIESIEQLKITGEAGKKAMEKLALGQEVVATINGKQYEGYVSRINQMMEMSVSGNSVVGFEVQLTESDDRIILGMDAKMKIHTGKSEGASVLPARAIGTDKEGDFVYVVNNGVIGKKHITCGIAADSYVEVLEGLDAKDQVVLSYTGDLEVGTEVEVTR